VLSLAGISHWQDTLRTSSANIGLSQTTCSIPLVSLLCATTTNLTAAAAAAATAAAATSLLEALMPNAVVLVLPLVLLTVSAGTGGAAVDVAHTIYATERGWRVT
jgi:hypothetical protein